jgi:3-hydroxyisobutyrate dehydrogenase-like beta-hydroxyacid dehydrogenase
MFLSFDVYVNNPHRTLSTNIVIGKVTFNPLNASFVGAKSRFSSLRSAKPKYPEDMNVSFVGLGKMGSAMARNLLRAGHQVAVFNRNREKAKALISDGATLANSPADACRNAEIVATMVSDDAALEELVFGNHGIASALEPNHIHVSHSTISTTLARRLTAEHDHRGQGYVSAPVFGRPDAAENRKLVVVAAGRHEWVERCQPLSEAVGRETFVVGPEPWQANAVKLCGNFMVVSMIEAFGEASAALRKARVSPHIFLDIMNALFGSPVIANYGRTIAEDQFEPAGFALRLGLKDVRLMLATADECQSPMPLASLIHDHLLSALAQGQGDMDWASISRILARNAGL